MGFRDVTKESFSSVTVFSLQSLLGLKPTAMICNSYSITSVKTWSFFI